MRNTEILLAAVIKRAVIDWLAYRDSKNMVTRHYYHTADAFFKSEEFEQYSGYDRDWLLELLDDMYRRGGYSVMSLEMSAARSEDTYSTAK